MNLQDYLNPHDWIISNEFSHSPALKHDVYVECIAEIRNNQTGEIIEYETSERIDPGEKFPCTYCWADGNYACDCNRSLFWHRAKGLEEDSRCGDGFYSVNLKNKKDGIIFYKEF